MNSLYQINSLKKYLYYKTNIKMSIEKIFTPMSGTFGSLVGKKWENILKLEKKHKVSIEKHRQDHQIVLLITGRYDMNVQETYEELRRKHSEIVSNNKSNSMYNKKKQLNKILKKENHKISKTLKLDKSEIKTTNNKITKQSTNPFSMLVDSDSESDNEHEESYSNDI